MEEDVSVIRRDGVVSCLCRAPFHGFCAILFQYFVHLSRDTNSAWCTVSRGANGKASKNNWSSSTLWKSQRSGAPIGGSPGTLADGSGLIVETLAYAVRGFVQKMRNPEPL